MFFLGSQFQKILNKNEQKHKQTIPVQNWNTIFYCFGAAVMLWGLCPNKSRKPKGPNNSSQPVEDRYSSSWPTRRSGTTIIEFVSDGLITSLSFSYSRYLYYFVHYEIMYHICNIPFHLCSLNISSIPNEYVQSMLLKCFGDKLVNLGFDLVSGTSRSVSCKEGNTIWLTTNAQRQP